MLEHVPHWLGQALTGLRAGADKLTIAELAGGTQATPLILTSPAFTDGARLPDRFTADGAGVSPPLLWDEPPAGTASLALLVEDADAPTPRPLVHAVAWRLAATAGRLAEGALSGDGIEAPGIIGCNSFGRQGWLPPDPPTGHGPHRYCFQLFALDADAPDAGDAPGRSALVDAMRGHVIAAGMLTATYDRGEPARAAPEGAAAGLTPG